MARRPVGLRGVAYCYFASHRVDGKRLWSWGRFGLFGVVPVLFGLLLAWQFGKPQDDALTMVIAVLSVLAAVLLGLLPLVHSIVGQTNTDRKYAVGEQPLAQQELDRVQTLQDLHAAISWAVILLVVALGCCALVALLPEVTAEQKIRWQPWIMKPILVVLYSIISSTALTFFDVARGVFEGMESHSEAIKTKIRNNVQRKAGDEEVED